MRGKEEAGVGCQARRDLPDACPTSFDAAMGKVDRTFS